MKIAILNDYLRLSQSSADWSKIAQTCEITVFDRAIAPGEAAATLKPFDIICTLRERMPITRELIAQLPNLKMPILIMNGEASFHAPFEHCTVKYLEQAGAKPTWIDLGRAGIHGNGHMIMLEKNSDEVARVIATWLDKAVPEKTAAR